jgi:hypothetical protein
MGLGSGIRKKPIPDPGSGSATLLSTIFAGIKAMPLPCPDSPYQSCVMDLDPDTV